MQSSGQRFVGANIVDDRITGELCMCARHACAARRYGCESGLYNTITAAISVKLNPFAVRLFIVELATTMLSYSHHRNHNHHYRHHHHHHWRKMRNSSKSLQ